VSKDKSGQKPAEEKPAAQTEEAGGAVKGKASKPAKTDKGQKTEKPQKPEKGAKQQQKAAAQKTEAPAEKKPKTPRDPAGYVPRLKKLFRETAAKDIREEFAYKTPMQVPRLTKIVVSVGLGEAIANKKILESSTAELSQITGMKAVRTKAKKSIAQFKVRKGMEVGAMVTLRGNTMYEFLDRLINVAMPRIKDFRGANPNAFDGHGNYSLGLTEQIIFPEIDYDKIERINGMNIAIVTTATSDAEARSLLTRLGMPFRK
jgi:large subunit ribosomal protein L5